MKVIRCLLKPGKEKPLQGFHPWVFSGSLDQIDEDYKSGDLVKVYSSESEFLGVGYLNPRSQIAIRMLSFKDEIIDDNFIEKKISDAISLRNRLINPNTNAYRVIHSEGDFFPGLIVDRYGDYLVAQFQTAWMDQRKELIAKLLMKALPVKGVFEKDDTEWREWEGLESRVGLLAGAEPPDFVLIRENGLEFMVDIHGGQKTGFFLDQRDNRSLIESHSKGRRVLNCFGYTGGFSVYALRGGAVQTVTVDTSEPALNTAQENFKLNRFSVTENSFIKEDVFNYLRSSRQEFDLIVLDPPAFCKSKSQLQQASRGYKDINLVAMKKIAAGGILFTASCSSYIDPDLFQKIVFAAAKDARRDVRILAKTSHAYDHPINIFHPEGEYLKGLLCLIQ